MSGTDALIGQIISHYRVLEKLGAGGMGVVYRARDERLDRDVALKVLPAGALADEAARRRFRKEALALARLNHSNIAAVYDFDTQNEVDFLAMECVAGQSLAERLGAGSLGEKEIATLGGQIAAALEEAHEHGIIHRDLKPGNILVTPKGQAKVLDFGLAKLLRPASEATTESLAETQATAGTLPYMAPEQLRGETTDARTDLFAAGAVLYEMCTRQRPFREPLATRLADAILHQPPVPPRAINPRISQELEHIILKCLEKEPENRYQSAKELGVDLRRLGASMTTARVAVVAPPKHAPGSWLFAGAGGVAALLVLLFALNLGGWRARIFGRAAGFAPGRIESLAVLPLANLSGDASQDYFADGMTEALITELSQLSGLKKVTSRTSVMRYKGGGKAMPQIGQELGVDALIEGSVQRAGDKVGITVQLIHAETDRHLWARSYERDLRDILALEREVARAIADEIQAKVTPAEHVRLITARRVNPEAHEAYLKGRYYWSRWTTEGFQRARQYFEQAIGQDPTYAAAYLGLANSYAVPGIYGVLAPGEAFPRAREAVQKALELDDLLGEAHACRGLIALEYDRDWREAERAFQRALELNPNDATAHQQYGLYLREVGRFGQAIEEAKKAEQLDPLSPAASTEVGVSYYYARQPDKAIEQLRKTLELDPGYFWAHHVLGEVYAQRGQYREAISQLQEGIEPSHGNPHFLAVLGYGHARAGDRKEAVKILIKLQEESKRHFVPSSQIALIYIGLDEKRAAITWLEKAYEQRDPLLTSIKAESPFDPLRSDPRFQNLLRRMRLPQ